MISNEHPWKGYTLDEIRLHRVVNATKMEIEKTRLAHITERYTDKSGSAGSMSIFSKVMGALDFVDYGVVAYKVGKTLFSIFRRKHRR